MPVQKTHGNWSPWCEWSGPGENWNSKVLVSNKYSQQFRFASCFQMFLVFLHTPTQDEESRRPDISAEIGALPPLLNCAFPSSFSLVLSSLLFCKKSNNYITSHSMLHVNKKVSLTFFSTWPLRTGSVLSKSQTNIEKHVVIWISINCILGV